MINEAEKAQLIAMVNEYRKYESQLTLIENEQEVLKVRFNEIAQAVEEMKNEELKLLAVLEEKYDHVFTANELISLLQ
jgi:hypothetical protein